MEEDMDLALPNFCCALFSCTSTAWVLGISFFRPLVVALPLGLEKKSPPPPPMVRWPSLPRGAWGVVSSPSVRVSYANRLAAGAALGGEVTPEPVSWATGASSGACSNRLSSALVAIFFTPRPCLPLAGCFFARTPLVGLRGAGLADVGLAAAASGAATVGAGAGATGLGRVGAAAATSAIRADVGDRGCSAALTGDRGALWRSFSPFSASRARVWRYIWAAREVYFASILSAPEPSQPCCLKNVRARPLPPMDISRSWSSAHVSSVVDLTKLMCTPRLRCTPAQDRQM
mmetsp:Transcript_18810/g.48296  ORF Transcript_18810/g.48296 Transcript_18810/m.48296 type:complete len:289 (-) Transcript_18810:224-1090(-)